MRGFRGVRGWIGGFILLGGSVDGIVSSGVGDESGLDDVAPADLDGRAAHGVALSRKKMIGGRLPVFGHGALSFN